MSTMCKNLLSRIERCHTRFQHDIKFFSKTHSTLVCHWVEYGHIFLQEPPGHFGVLSCMFFLPEIFRQGGTAHHSFNQQIFLVFGVPFLKIFGQAHIGFHPPPSRCYCCLVDGAILVALSWDWTFIFLLAITSGFGFGLDVGCFSHGFGVVFCHNTAHIGQTPVADFNVRSVAYTLME